MKRLTAIALVLVLAAGLSIPAFAAQSEYTITDPYKDVKWGEWELYKANLHTHTTFSDGGMHLSDVVEAYYSEGYDVLSITDHGVLGKDWDTRPLTVPPLDIQNWFSGKRTVLDTKRYDEIKAGTGRESKRGMLPITTGIEMNAAVIMKNHVNGYFANWGQGWIGLENDYRTPIAMTEKNGGISYINHPGDWADDVNDPDTINFFANILRDYDSCLGMEVYNRVDTVTRHDRTLWDHLLTRLMPEKRPVLGFANDDSHKRSDIGGTAELMYMPKNTVENVRTCMETGAFLASSRRDRIVLGDGDEYVGDTSKPFPSVTNITKGGNKITLAAADTTEITWITDGGVTVGTGDTVDLTDARIKSYVRAQLVDEGGISLTQAFGIDKGDGYQFADDSLQGWDLFVWYIKMNLQKNIIAKLINEIAKLGK